MTGSASPAAAGFSKSEMMIVAAARELKGQRVCFVGVGLPNIAVNLAKRTAAPDLELVYESGVFGAEPARLPLSIGDPTIVTGATAVTSMYELFALYLQRGLVDVGFLGGAQIDRFGNLNSTCIGDYAAPSVRFSGSGGACDAGSLASAFVVFMQHGKRKFVEKLDYLTTPGWLTGGTSRQEAGFKRGGPLAVVTDLGVLKFAEPGKEMYLAEYYPGVTPQQVADNTGFELDVSAAVEAVPPTEQELCILRTEVDPQRLILG
jgi:glutaconate CoA-transferase, subunit B